MSYATGHVLVVSENEADRSSLLSALGTEFRVAEACSRAQAVQAAETTHPRCVVVDASADNAEVLALVERLVRIGPPVVLLTPTEDDAFHSALLQAGAQDCLPKLDAHPAALRRAVRHAVARALRASRGETQRPAAQLEATAQPAADPSAHPASIGELTAFVEAFGAPVLLLRPDRSVRFANAALRTLVGLEADPEARVDRFCDPEALAEILDALTVDPEQPLLGLSALGFRDSAGHVVPTQAQAFVLKGLAGTQTYAIVAQDLRPTDDARRTDEATLRLDAARRLAGRVGRIFDGLLTSVRTHGGLVRERLYEVDPAREDLEAALLAAERGSDLSRGLLAFSGQRTAHTMPVELSGALKRSEGLVRRLIGPGLALEYALDAGVGAVEADPAQLDQILIALVLNAVEASQAGGRITVSSAIEDVQTDDVRGVDGPIPKGRYATLSVTDVGGGMDEETRSRVCNPFFTTKSVGDGCGLGLSTALGIAGRHGAYLAIDSALGAGTTVRLYLPKAKGRADTMPPQVHNSMPLASPYRATVLVCDEDFFVRETARRALEDHGYEVFQAESPGVALTIVVDAAKRVDLLVASVDMAEMSGVELFMRCRVQFPELSILLTSDRPDEHVQIPGHSEPRSTLRKPFRPAELVRLAGQCVAPASNVTEEPDPTGAAVAQILVVDEETFVRQSTRRILERKGYGVNEASGPEEAVALLAEDPTIDLLLTDIVMPKMTGPELAERCRQTRPDLQVVYMSTYPGDVVVVQNLNEPGVVIQKPFHPPQLLRVVGGVLGVAPPEGLAENALHLMLIDDETYVLAAMKRSLEEAGHRVTLAATLLDARQILSGHFDEFDAILCDQQVASESAFDFYVWLVDEDASSAARFFVLTGAPLVGEAAAFFEALRGRIIRKPVDTQALLDRIGAVAVVGSAA